MKKLLFVLLVISSLFADYKVTQYYGSGNRLSPIKNSWITESFNGLELNKLNRFRRTTSLFFIHKRTGKKVMASIPFTLEEL